jgi:hypothetical protein
MTRARFLPFDIVVIHGYIFLYTERSSRKVWDVDGCVSGMRNVPHCIYMFIPHHTTTRSPLKCSTLDLFCKEYVESLCSFPKQMFVFVKEKN